jgi:hypothetical protein
MPGGRNTNTDRLLNPWQSVTSSLPELYLRFICPVLASSFRGKMAASSQVVRTQGLLWRRLFGGVTTYETNTGRQRKTSSMIRSSLIVDKLSIFNDFLKIL